jgi:FXSXX-COOH protein
MDSAEFDPKDSDLVDVTQVPLEKLVSLKNTVLANALRRLLAEFDHPQEIIAAFDNYAGDPAAHPPERG